MVTVTGNESSFEPGYAADGLPLREHGALSFDDIGSNRFSPNTAARGTSVNADTVQLTSSRREVSVGLGIRHASEGDMPELVPDSPASATGSETVGMMQIVQ